MLTREKGNIVDQKQNRRVFKPSTQHKGNPCHPEDVSIPQSCCVFPSNSQSWLTGISSSPGHKKKNKRKKENLLLTSGAINIIRTFAVALNCEIVISKFKVVANTRYSLFHLKSEVDLSLYFLMKINWANSSRSLNSQISALSLIDSICPCCGCVWSLT